MRASLILVAFLTSASALCAQSPPAPEWVSDETVSTEGYYTLTWSLPQGDSLIDQGFVFELAEAPRRDASGHEVIYRGPDLASTQSGKSNGSYYYRVRLVKPETGETGPWNEVLEVRVEHHALSRAFLFLAIGAIVFVATAATILTGRRGEKELAKGAMS